MTTWRRPLVDAAPLALAVFVFGVSFGVLALGAHLPAWGAILMSAIIYAGSAQFAAISLLASGAGVLPAILTGALLNLRYVATGIAAAPALPGGRWRRALLGQLVIDESYALGVRAGGGGRPDGLTMIVAGACLWLAWVAGTAVGVAVGGLLGNPGRFGLDAAFPAAFIALLWPMLHAPGARRCALAGAGVALAMAPFTPPGVPLAGAALVGIWLSR
jgi:4-azaleucine resistance transporter AzlC